FVEALARGARVELGIRRPAQALHRAQLQRVRLALRAAETVVRRGADRLHQAIGLPRRRAAARLDEVELLGIGFALQPEQLDLHATVAGDEHEALRHSET